MSNAFSIVNQRPDGTIDYDHPETSLNPNDFYQQSSYIDVLGATFSKENIIGSTVNYLMGDENTASEGTAWRSDQRNKLSFKQGTEIGATYYNKAQGLSIPEDYAEKFFNVRNDKEFEATLATVQKEMKANEVISRGTIKVQFLTYSVAKIFDIGFLLFFFILLINNFFKQINFVNSYYNMVYLTKEIINIFCSYGIIFLEKIVSGVLVVRKIGIISSLIHFKNLILKYIDTKKQKALEYEEYLSEKNIYLKDKFNLMSLIKKNILSALKKDIIKEFILLLCICFFIGSISEFILSFQQLVRYNKNITLFQYIFILYPLFGIFFYIIFKLLQSLSKNLDIEHKKSI